MVILGVIAADYSGMEIVYITNPTLREKDLI